MSIACPADIDAAEFAGKPGLVAADAGAHNIVSAAQAAPASSRIFTGSYSNRLRLFRAHLNP
jgi:hypothetical protein